MLQKFPYSILSLVPDSHAGAKKQCRFLQALSAVWLIPHTKGACYTVHAMQLYVVLNLPREREKSDV